MKRKKLTGGQRLGYVALGLVGMAFCVIAVMAWLNAAPYIHFELWNTQNIQPYLTGNQAVDERIVSNAGWSNTMVQFMAAVVVAGWFLIAGLSIQKIYQASIGSVGKD